MPPFDPTQQTTWADLLNRYGPWLVALVAVLVMHYLGGGKGTPDLPPLPIAQAVPPGHTAIVETDAAGKVRMTVAPSP